MFRLLTLISSLLVAFAPFSSYAEPQHWLAKKGGNRADDHWLCACGR